MDSPLANYQSNPNDDDDFVFDTAETFPTAWSFQVKGRLGRTRGIFGSRGNNTRSSTRKPLPPLRDSVLEESGYLGDECSPEKAKLHRRNSISAYGGRQSSSSSSFSRPRISRSMSLSTAMPFAKSERHHLRRSSSVFSTELTNDTSYSSSTEGFSCSLVDFIENGHPNLNGDTATDFSETDANEQRERKKIRARKTSVEGYIAPLSDALQKPATKTSFSDLARSSDPTLAWLLPPPSSPLRTRSSTFSTLDDLYEPSSLSRPSSSSSARKKRGVCGSPISDIDDWSCGAMSTGMTSSSSKSARRHSRSRSRIFSPSPGRSLPLAPSLIVPAEDAHREMEVESEEDDNENDDDSVAASSRNNSFDDSHGDLSNASHSSKFQTGEAKEQVDVFATMSSYDDLKFLIKKLRHENSGRSVLSSFGFTNSWSVAPLKNWSSSRKSAFVQWTVRHLGFSLHYVSGSVPYIQISKTQGIHVLAKLEQALVDHKKREQEHRPIDAAVDSSTDNPDTVPQKTDLSVKPSHHHLSLILDEGNEDDVLSQMNALSMKETDNSKLIVRTVTIDPGLPPRHSLDCHERTMDLMYHLHGYSPDAESIVRPPRFSPESACSSGTVSRGRPSGQFLSRLPPIQSQEILETPLMNDNNGGWGSQPMEGRDWGDSSKCEGSVMEELFSRFEVAGKLEGVRDSFEGGYGLFQSASSSLAFELEAGALETEPVVLHAKTVQFDEQEDSDTTDKGVELDDLQMKRIRISLAKRRRVSLWSSTLQHAGPLVHPQKPLFRAMKSLGPISDLALLSLSPRRNDFPFDEAPAPDSLIEETDYESEGELAATVLLNDKVLPSIFEFLTEAELLRKASLVCTTWANTATTSHAKLMYASIGCSFDVCSDEDFDNEDTVESCPSASLLRSMERSWNYIHNLFPCVCFLSEGAFKRVYKAFNSVVGEDEAISVMDTHAIHDKKTIGAELAVSAMLSSLSRRGICPNFVITRGVFTSGYEPPSQHWGNAEKKNPSGVSYVLGKKYKAPRQPIKSQPGRYQFIRMEFCNEGDAEEFLKRQPDEVIDPEVAKAMLFQMAFALHAAADRFSVKHYDVKLLNFFLNQYRDLPGSLVLRYGLGAHTYAVTMPSEKAFIVKLADYGTATVGAESNSQPVTIAQFTTLENTPPDYMILGDEATQGHGHDCFGLGLCMLHLFTGHAPYEEILNDVFCPDGLKKRLKRVWECESTLGFSVIRSVILCDVYKDDVGNIIEGEPDETLYHTLYRFLVLFGIPTKKFQQKSCPLVWKAISDSFEISKSCGVKGSKKRAANDVAVFSRDRRKYSIEFGTNKYIRRARKRLESLDGGMELLRRLCSFDPATRASALEVLNSVFMETLREPEGNVSYGMSDTVKSFMDFSMRR